VRKLQAHRGKDGTIYFTLPAEAMVDFEKGSTSAEAKSFAVLRHLMTVIAIPPLLPRGEDGNRDHYAGHPSLRRERRMSGVRSRRRKVPGGG